MRSCLKRLGSLNSAAGLGSVIALVIIVSPVLAHSTQNFSVPDDVALRIRLDDTCGHIAQIDMSGRIKGHTSMMLSFDRLVMPDGVGHRFTPKLLSFIMPLQARR